MNALKHIASILEKGGGKSNIRFTGFSYIDDACGMFRLAAGVVRHAPKYVMPNFQMVLNPELFCPTEIKKL